MKYFGGVQSFRLPRLKLERETATMITDRMHVELGYSSCYATTGANSQRVVENDIELGAS